MSPAVCWEVDYEAYFHYGFYRRIHPFRPGRFPGRKRGGARSPRIPPLFGFIVCVALILVLSHVDRLILVFGYVFVTMTFLGGVYSFP